METLALVTLIILVLFLLYTYYINRTKSSFTTIDNDDYLNMIANDPVRLANINAYKNHVSARIGKIASVRNAVDNAVMESFTQQRNIQGSHAIPEGDYNEIMMEAINQKEKDNHKKYVSERKFTGAARSYDTDMEIYGNTWSKIRPSPYIEGSYSTSVGEVTSQYYADRQGKISRR